MFSASRTILREKTNDGYLYYEFITVSPKINPAPGLQIKKAIRTFKSGFNFRRHSVKFQKKPTSLNFVPRKTYKAGCNLALDLRKRLLGIKVSGRNYWDYKAQWMIYLYFFIKLETKTTKLFSYLVKLRTFLFVGYFRDRVNSKIGPQNVRGFTARKHCGSFPKETQRNARKIQIKVTRVFVFRIWEKDRFFLKFKLLLYHRKCMFIQVL